jgi:hypothetical protein
MGHELGSGSYVLDREPDLILFAVARGGLEPVFRSGVELSSDRRFLERYRPVVIEGLDPFRSRMLMHARFEGGRVGTRREAARVEVPAFFLAGTLHQVAGLDAGGRLAARVAPGATAALPDLALGPGDWALRVDASAPVEVEVWEEARLLDRGPGAAAFALARRGAISVRVRASGGTTADVALLVFERS